MFNAYEFSLQESVIDLVQSNWDKCEEKACEAIAMAQQLQSVNVDILVARMKSRIGTVRRLRGELKGAWELMNEAYEVSDFVYKMNFNSRTRFCLLLT